MEPTATPKATLSIETGFPSHGRQVSAEELEQGARLWRDALSSHPLYAKKAKRSEELTGDPLSFWKHFFASGVNSLPKPKASSTAAEA